MSKETPRNSSPGNGTVSEIHYRYLRRWALDYLSSRGIGDPEDFFHEVFCHFLKKTPPDHAKFDAWFGLRLKSRSVSSHRRTKRHEGHLRALAESLDSSCGFDWTGIHAREVGAAVQDALLRLDASDRVIIRMRYLEDRSVREVAEALGMSNNNVKSRAFRAVRRLRPLLRTCVT